MQHYDRCLLWESHLLCDATKVLFTLYEACFWVQSLILLKWNVRSCAMTTCLLFIMECAIHICHGISMPVQIDSINILWIFAQVCFDCSFHFTNTYIFTALWEPCFRCREIFNLWRKYEFVHLFTWSDLPSCRNVNRAVPR